ncbi:sensor histidine kinase [Taibaiella soli]|uniref:histidine kinase n=1 Tax=Taibaiella soli TaxID=1649169 RepID=A0A2W2AHV6_9BACT|nr:PAS domain-containing sensor histidine kinase [Taibaiella soli]PZF74861.1 PAS domain-containing sensor histidine kinase [Taibaiella soli]
MSGNKAIGFDVLFDNASLGILVANHQGTILLTNPFLLRQFGYEETELVGQEVGKLIPARLYEQARLANRYFSSNGKQPKEAGIDLYVRHKDGTEFPVEVSLSHYEASGDKYIIAYLSDISRRKEVEQALQQLNDELEQKVEDRTQTLTGAVEQLAALVAETEAKDADLRTALEKEKELSELKSRFVSMASHEFRTPLSTILSSAYLISKYEEKEDHSKREKHVHRIVSSVNMLADVLNDFLSVGKIEEGKIQVRYSVFDIIGYLTEVVTEMNCLLKPGQEIVYSHHGTPDVRLDPALTKHIVLNLLSNAIKFSPAHTNIKLNTVCKDQMFSLSVTDKGVGIPDEDQQHLFGRFFRGTNVTHISGTGLGLHIVGKYTELMNGSIAFSSKINCGTTFKLQFNISGNT